MILCPRCNTPLPDEAQYCLKCGAGIKRKETVSPSYRWDIFALSILATVGLSAVLMWVFHLPVLIAGAFLPLIWVGRRRK